MTEREVIEWNGRNYYRYPKARSRSVAKYFRSVKRLLHRDVWEFHNGPIPPGVEIHHVNGDAADNCIDNLAAVPAEEHLRFHYALRAESIKASQKKAWLSRPLVEFKCTVCDAVFGSRSIITPKFCSERCRCRKALSERRYHVPRTCEYCQGTWLVRSSSKAKCCSYVCAGKNRFRDSREAVIGP